MDSRMTAGKDLFVTANGLRLHLLEWGTSGPVVLLLHGYLEHAHAWDFVAPHLVDGGHHVFALDWRGHGESAWVGAGGYYHFPDYVADLAGVVRALGGQAVVVGHSMGGGAAVLYAGTEPERVRALISVEGIGIPDSDPDTAPGCFAAWIDDLERAGRRRRVPLSLDAAAQRLRDRFPRFSEDVARHMALHGTRETAAGRVWKFDLRHQTRSPQPAYVAQARAFWRRVSCPVLYVDGADSDLRLPVADLEDRLATLRAERASIAAAGHHPHLEHPQETARVIGDFLSRRVSRP